MTFIDVIVEPELAWEERERVRVLAEQNATKLGLSNTAWQRLRCIQNHIVADLLMAHDPQLPPERPTDGPKGSARPLGSLRFDELVSELREGRRCRNLPRIRQLIEELKDRKSKSAARIAASARLALLAIERPDVLPFRAE